MITTEKISFICTFCGKQEKSFIVMRVKWIPNKRGRLEPYCVNSKDFKYIKQWEHKNLVEHSKECSVPPNEKVRQLYGI